MIITSFGIVHVVINSLMFRRSYNQTWCNLAGPHELECKNTDKGNAIVGPGSKNNGVVSAYIKLLHNGYQVLSLQFDYIVLSVTVITAHAQFRGG